MILKIFLLTARIAAVTLVLYGTVAHADCAPDWNVWAGYYFRLTTVWRGNGMALDIVNDGINNNRPILAPTGNYSGQAWRIIPIPGTCYVRLTTMWRGDSMALDIFNDGINNNRPILAPTGNYSGQYWKVTPIPGRFLYYRLTNMWRGDGMALDIFNDGINNNQPILAPTGNYSGQHWYLTVVGEVW